MLLTVLPHSIHFYDENNLAYFRNEHFILMEKRNYAITFSQKIC